MKSIFIHSMWRTASTYIWSQFRRNGIYRTYYEPLHEFLWKALKPGGELTLESAAKARRLHHPELGRPYFAEYPLRACGGVANFQKRFSYERYWLDENGQDDGLRLYFAHLIAHAAEAGQIPVFKFNRSSLRAGWLAKNFPSIGILLLRRPMDIWKSFSSQDDYYAATLCLIVGQNRDHPVLDNLAAVHRIPTYRAETVQQEIEFYRPVARRRGTTLYPLFYQFHALASVHSLLYADCVIDLNAITESDEARSCVENRLCALGAGISLSDCRVPIHEDLSLAEREWMAYEREGRDEVATFLRSGPLIPQNKLREHESCLSDYYRETFATFAG